MNQMRKRISPFPGTSKTPGRIITKESKYKGSRNMESKLGKLKGKVSGTCRRKAKFKSIAGPIMSHPSRWKSYQKTQGERLLENEISKKTHAVKVILCCVHCQGEVWEGQMIHPWKAKGMGGEGDNHILLLGSNNREREAIFQMQNSKKEEGFTVSLPRERYVKCT